MPLSFLLHFHDGFFNNWIKITLSFVQSKIGHADKNSISLYPSILSHGEQHLSNELIYCSASSKSVGIFVVRWWICSITERILHWFQKHRLSQSIFMPDSHLSQGTSLRRQHLRSFQCNFNYYLLHDIQKHKITDFFCRTILQMCRNIRCLSATA